MLTLVELLRQLMERQALRRIDAGSVTAEEVERLGRTFLALSQRMDELKHRDDSRQAIEHMLDLITQIADYVCEHKFNGLYAVSIVIEPCALAYAQLRYVAQKHKRKVEEFKKEFTRAKELFDRSIDLEILRIVRKIGELLCPARYSALRTGLYLALHLPSAQYHCPYLTRQCGREIQNLTFQVRICI